MPAVTSSNRAAPGPCNCAEGAVAARLTGGPADRLGGVQMSRPTGGRLPDQDETTVNGVAPATSVQGGTARVTYVFAVAPRTPGGG
jgi:hypothetical protein